MDTSIQKGEDTNEDVTDRIKVGLLKWKDAYDVLCDNKILLRLEGKIL